MVPVIRWFVSELSQEKILNDWFWVYCLGYCDEIAYARWYGGIIWHGSDVLVRQSCSPEGFETYDIFAQSGNS